MHSEFTYTEPGGQMLTLHPRHVRLFIEENLGLAEIPEAFRTAIQVCRFNELRSALVATKHPETLELRAGLRATLRTMTARAMMPPIRLALVGMSPGAMAAFQGLQDLAVEHAIPCEIFTDEANGVAWCDKFDGDNVVAIR